MRCRIDFRIVLAFVSGATVAVAAAAIWFMASPSARAQEGDATTDNISSINSTYIDALNKNLREVGTQITDPGISSFYNKLIDGYGLETVGGNVSDSLLPEVATIQRRALMLPFQEAAKDIHDKDIADFYGKLLDDTGLSAAR